MTPRRKAVAGAADNHHDERALSSDVFDGLGHDYEAVLALEREKHRRWAKQTVDAEVALAEFIEPPSAFTLADELAEPLEPLKYRVEDLHVQGGNVILSAVYKVGKTTLLLNLAHSLLSGKPFLGRFDVEPLAGRVAFWNYELSKRQFLDWCERAWFDSVATRMSVAHLRGYPLPIWTPVVEDYAVSWLASRETEVWVIDPLIAAANGVGSINDNDDMQTFLAAIDRIKRRAGVQDVVIAAHASDRYRSEEGQEHPLGASVLDGWPDTRWVFTKNAQEQRFFKAHGRDVDVPEGELHYDNATYRLRWASASGRRVVRDLAGLRAAVQAVAENEGSGTRAVRDAIKGPGVRGADRDRLLRRAESKGYVRVDRTAGQKGHRHFLTDEGRAFLEESGD